MEASLDFEAGKNGEMGQSMVESCATETVEHPALVIEDGNRSATTVETAWGSDKQLEMNPFHIVKVLTVNVGKTLSPQRHDSKDETYVLESGVAQILLGQKEDLI